MPRSQPTTSDEVCAYCGRRGDDVCDTVPADLCEHAELGDDEIEAIQMNAADAAFHAATPHAIINPYAPGSRRADIWAHAFRSAYARENGY